MNILQWNIRSYSSNFEDLKILLNEVGGPNCVCLQETRNNTLHLYPPSNYVSIQPQKNRDDDSERGVAILINKKTNYTRLQLTTSDKVEAVAVRIWDKRYYTICCLYLSPSIRHSKEDIRQIIQQLPKPFLLLGDMNARHPAWGEPSESTNANGRIFNELLEEEDILLLNSETKTHHSTQHGSYSLIDLSLCSPDIYPEFNYKVIQNLHGSDHFPITIEKLPPPAVGEASFRLITERADWTSYRLLTSHYAPPEEQTGTDEKVSHLTQFILQAAQAAIPVNAGGNTDKVQNPWFNKKCREIYKKRLQAQRALERNHTTENLIAYRRLHALCRRTIKVSKRESWEAYVSSISINTTPTEMWKKIGKIKGKHSKHPPPLLEKPTGGLTDDPAETAEIFNQTFANVSHPSNYSPEFQRHRDQFEKRPINFFHSRANEKHYNEPFTSRELESALSSIKESSPGDDGIVYSLVKNSDPSLKKYLLELYNHIFSTNTFPSSWKLAVIVPIPKPGKDHSMPLNYRPISLTSCLCKLMERMVNSRLVWFLESNKYISQVQSGFRSNRNTTDCLLQLSSDIEQSIIENKHTIAIFYDLEKAYDKAWRRYVLNRIYGFGLRGNLPIFIENFMSQRCIKTKVGKTYSDPIQTVEGIPQGSVLSCTLFAIAIDEVTKLLPNYIKHTLYVDDLTIYASGKRVESIQRKLQIANRKLETWSAQTGFKFSAQKTVAMHFCRKKKCTKPVGYLTLNDTAISAKESHTYLGMVLDRSLTWNKHIDYIRAECRRRMNLLKHLNHTEWGADCGSLLRIYTAIIKSKLEYGSEAYGSASASTLAKLNPIQNEAIRIATGAFRCSRTTSMEILSGLLPLDLSRQNKFAKHIMRIKANPRNPLYNLTLHVQENEEVDENPIEPTQFATRSIKSRITETERLYETLDIPVWEEEPATFPPWRVNNLTPCDNIIQNAKQNISENVLKTIFLSHLDSHNNEQNHIYTDGSKTADGSAYAMVCRRPRLPNLNRSSKLHRDATIFTSELYAIQEAVKTGKSLPSETTVIISDSKSSIQALTKPFSKNSLVKNIQKEAYDSTNEFLMCWVPSHIGVHGNEIADKLARETTKRTEVLQTPLLRNDLDASIKRKTKAEWQTRWQNMSPNLNHLRSITDSLSPLSNTFSGNRSWGRTLARLRLGYSRLTHGYVMARDHRPICDMCDEESQLTIKHILIDCPNYRAARIRAFCRPRITLKEILIDGDTAYGGPLYKYLEEIQIRKLI